MKSKKRKKPFETKRAILLEIKMCERSLFWCKKTLQEALASIDEVTARKEIKGNDLVDFCGGEITIESLRRLVSTFCRRADLDQQLLDCLRGKYKKLIIKNKKNDGT